MVDLVAGARISASGLGDLSRWPSAYYWQVPAPPPSCRQPEALARALVDGDPELDLEVAGRETGPCDRVYLGHDAKPLYSGRLLHLPPSSPPVVPARCSCTRQKGKSRMGFVRLLPGGLR
jgi:hypothetical protein